MQKEVSRINPQAVKRPIESARKYLSAAKAQRVNQITHEWEEDISYEEDIVGIDSVYNEHENDSECCLIDEVHILGAVPSYRV